ncbi:MAG: pteridine reductase [marine bacterium B5-7]|nr:MAG: pteridine reductase [marine bacterium B5-7]
MINKTALVTGAAKRIGAAIAEHLHSSGMNVIIHYNSSAKEAHELVRKLNGIRRDSAIMIQANLEHKEYYSALIDAALNFKGGLDVLINNASAYYPTSLASVDDQQWNELINTNLKAPLFLSQLATKSLRANKGCIINITDIHANRPLRSHTVYSVSKAGLVMLTQSLAKELAPAIRVNAISPGVIMWPDDIKEEKKNEILNETMMKRTGNVEDITKAALFLIKDADYITGQVLNIDGGRTLYS